MSTSDKPSIVLVMEKPGQAKRMAALLANHWSAHRVFAIFTNYVGLYEFRYPRGLSYSDLPYIGDPLWRPRSAHPSPVEFIASEVHKTSLTPSHLLKNAEAIWYACDPDSSGAVAYQVLLTQCLGNELAALDRPAMLLQSLAPEDIQRALDKPASTASPLFRAWLNAGEARRFFDFNYNVNSMALFGDCLRRVGVNTDTYGMSKYSLQLLYACVAHEGISDMPLLLLMESWPGTGRYQPSAIGSPASRHVILSGLLDAGLLDSNDRKVSVSERGRRFLDLLHPDCEDADLPARLLEWQRDWPVSKPKVERYLRTFFGKQKRFK
jgi:DNA topoisomerase IA